MNLKKCFLLENVIVYPGQIVQPAFFTASDKANDTIHRLQQPTSMTKLKSVLVICDVCKQFVPNFAYIRISWNWSLENTSFPTLKD